jgi:hypothetical protein
MSKEDEKLNQRRLIDQSALIQNIGVLKTAKFQNIKTGPLVAGISLSEEGSLENSGITINKLYNFKEFIKAYSELTPASLSCLIPYIKIFKIYENNTEFPIPFNNYYPKSSIDAITNNNSDRGFQANLVNLEFISQGKDTATTFIYQVKMNIIFDSVQTLFNENSRYIELFNPPKKHRFKRGERDLKYYQIKLKFGWNFNSQLPSDLKPQQLQAFTNASGSEMFLNYVIHRITMNEDGSVALQVEYIGALEAESRDPNTYSVLTNAKIQELDETSKKIEYYENKAEEQNILIEKEYNDDKVKIKFVKKNEPTKELESSTVFGISREQLETLYTKQKTNETANKNDFTNSIINNIIEQYSGSLPYLSINEQVYNQRSTLIEGYSDKNTLDNISKETELKNLESDPNNVIFVDSGFTLSGIKDLDNYFSNVNFVPNVSDDRLSYNIHYFTFGRLLKAIESLGKPKSENQEIQESDFIILASDCNISSFGNGTYIDPRILARNPKYKIILDNGLGTNGSVLVLENKITQINMLEIPIAFSTFKYWINKNITSQNLSQMSLLNFLNSTVIELLNLAVKPTNEDYVPKQNIQFKFFFDKVEFNNDDSFLEVIRRNQGPSEILNKQSLIEETNGTFKDFIINKQIKTSNLIKKNIIVFYTLPSYNQRKSNLEKDLEDGIPHFYYGQKNGIINKITFREENMPFVRESNIQTQVSKKPWKAGVFLRGKYNVTIDMLGTVNFRIGSMIYISPSFPGVINYGEPIEYGIGGYFVIVSIKTSIESGKYITTIEANWVATGTGEYTDLSHLPITIKRLPPGETTVSNLQATLNTT